MIFAGFAIAWLLYQRRRTFLAMQIQRIGVPDEVVPHAVLVMTMSHTGSWRVDDPNNQLTRANGEPLRLTGSLGEVLDRLAALGEWEKFSWEQLLRAVRKHMQRPEKRKKVVLLGSPVNQGTAKRFEECRTFIRLFPRVFPSMHLTRRKQNSTVWKPWFMHSLMFVYR